MRNLLLLILSWGLCSGAFAQKKLLLQPYQPKTLKATIGEFLEELKQYNGTVLEYSSNNIAADKLIQLEGNETTIGRLLQKVLDGQHVKLLEHNGKIILVPSPVPFTAETLMPVRYSFYGYIKEEESREPLTDATIYEPSVQRGVVSNSYGYFNLLLPEGQHKIEISYNGMQPVTVELSVHGNVHRDVALSVKNEAYPTIVIQSEETVKDGSFKVEADEAFSGNLMGEPDPVRASYLSPGVQNIATSLNGFQVRGGGTDENLFLLDGNPVYNPTHLLGALSIINQTALRSMRLYKGDFPARFSGSLSSVLDVYTKDGNMKSWHGEANAGLLAGSFALEGPLVKNRTAIMVSARKNISLPFYRSFQDSVAADFYDAHFRMTSILNAKNKLTLNFYKGEDQLKQSGKEVDNLHKWGNMLGAAGWNYVLGSRSFVATSVNFSQYQNLGGFQYTLYKDDDEKEIIQTKSIGTYSSIRQLNLKSQAEIYASKKLKLNLGVKAAQTTIKPFDNKITTSIEANEKSFTSFAPLQFEELSSYAEAEMKLGKSLFVKPGLHATAYRFKDYQTMALQPRFFIAYRFLPAHTISASYSKMSQFLHLVTNPYLGANKDLWVPSTAHLQPEGSEVYNIGYTFHRRRVWKLVLDGYYKRLANVTNYAEGKSMFFNNKNWEQTVETGRGRSYGAECIVKKKGVKLSWQFAYALSWSWRQFRSINGGKEFPYKYDRRHTANFGFTYAITPRLDVSGLWTFATGDVYTLPSQIYPDFDNAQQISTPDDPLDKYRFVYRFAGADQFRTKSYQRYDAAISYHSKKDQKLHSVITAGIYNINGDPDQYSYTLHGSLNSKSIIIKTGNSIFKMTPYLSYTLKF